MPIVERRRWPRIGAAGSGELTQPIAAPAQVLDLGRDGALVVSPRVYEPGQRGRLLMNLSGEVFRAGFEVRHVEVGEEAVRVGVRFVDVEPLPRKAIDQWIERARR
jgi:hypothetical protein